MSQEDRDYWKTGFDKGLHPPICSCAECCIARNKRLEPQYINNIENNKNKIRRFNLENQNNQETNPTPEQWQQNRNYQQPPYNQPFSMPEEYQQQPRGSKLGGGMGAIFIAVALSLVLCYAMISFLGITPSMKQYKADITRLEMDLVDVRGVNTQQASGISALQGAITTANAANTKATDALTLSSTLQTQYDTLNTTLTALQTRVTDLEAGNTGDVYDDTIVKGLINAVEDDITAINNTIATLQAYDTTNTINISALQNSIATIQSQITTLQGGSSVVYNDTEIRGLITALTNRVTALEANTTPLDFDEFNADSDYCTFTTHKAGTYIVIITLYGTGFSTIDMNTVLGITAGSNARILTCYTYGDTMCTAILTQTETITTPTGTAIVDTNWTKGEQVTLKDSSTATNILYGTIQIGDR